MTRGKRRRIRDEPWADLAAEGQPNMKYLLITLVCALLMSGCVTPISYGDASGFMGMGFIAKKTVFLGYEGPVKPFEEVGVLALDARLRIRSIQTPDGELVRAVSKTIGGLGIINTANDEQIHLLPGGYLLSVCFYLDMGNQGSAYCNTPLNLAVVLVANQMVQLSWASVQSGGWTVLRQAVNEEIRARIVRDFLAVMAASQSSSP